LTLANTGGSALTLGASAVYRPTLFGTGPSDISLLRMSAGGAVINSAALLTLDLSGISTTQRDTLRAAGMRDYMVLTTAAPITGGGFSAANFSTIDPAGRFAVGEWSLGTGTANSVVVHFQPVPEPACVTAVCAAGLGAAAWVRRRRG
jgi:hypothetical protein